MTRATLDGTDGVIGRLREAAERLYGHDRYRGAFEEAGRVPGDVDSVERFRELSTVDASDRARDVRSDPPLGSPVGPGSEAGEDAFLER